jgi:hypothetical protein
VISSEAGVELGQSVEGMPFVASSSMATHHFL